MNLEDAIQQGTRASQPVASDVAEGTLYYVTDEQLIEQSLASAWTPYSPGGTGGQSASRNSIINGGFWQAQRQVPGTLTTYSQTAARGYTADRWAITNENASVQYARGDSGTTPETNLKSRHYGRFVKITNAGKMCISQVMTAEECDNLRGQTIRVQMRMKASTATTMRVALLQLQAAGTIDVIPGYTTGTGPAGTFISAFGADGTDPTFGTNLAKITPDFADNATIANSGLSCSVTTAWQRFGGIFTGPTDFKNLVLVVFTNADVAAAVEIDIAEVGIYLGGGLREWDDTEYQLNTQRCYRYYAKSFGEAIAPAQSAGLSSSIVGWVSQAGAVANQPIPIRWPVTMRSGTLLITFFNPSAANAFARNTSVGADATATAAANTNGVGTEAQFTGVAGWLAGAAMQVHYTSDAEL